MPAWRAKAARWESRLQKRFNLGTVAPGTAPRRPTNYERVVREEGELLKAEPEPERAERREQWLREESRFLSGVTIFPHTPRHRPNTVRTIGVSGLGPLRPWPGPDFRSKLEKSLQHRKRWTSVGDPSSGNGEAGEGGRGGGAERKGH